MVDDVHVSHRPERRSDQRSGEILAAALGVLARRGWADARLDDVAEMAGISKGGIYHYFVDKEALLAAALDRTFAATLSALEQVPVDGAPAERVRELARQFWGLARSREVRDAYRLSLAKPSLVGRDLRYRWRGLAIRVLRRFGRAIADGSSEGVFRPVDPLVATRVLLSLLLKHAEWRAPGSLFIEVSRDDETTLAELLDFFLWALRPEGITAWPSGHPGAPE